MYFYYMFVRGLFFCCFLLLLSTNRLRAEQKPGIKKTHKALEWRKSQSQIKKELSVSHLLQDVTYLKSWDIPPFTMQGVLHSGAAALLAHEDHQLRLWRLKDAQVPLSAPLPEDKDVERIYISGNDRYAILVLEASNRENWSVMVYRLSDLTRLCALQMPMSLDIAIDPAEQYFLNLLPGNTIEKRNLETGALLQTYQIPNYDEKNLYYTKIERLVCAPDVPDLVYLLDLGQAEELSSLKVGVHLNIIPFYLDKTTQILNPILFYKSVDKSLSVKAFHTMVLSRNGKHLFVALKNKLLHYDFKRHIKEELNTIAIYKTLWLDATDRFLVGNGDKTVAVWQLLEDTTSYRRNALRLLRKMPTRTIMAHLTPGYRYLIGMGATQNRLDVFYASDLIKIKDTPAPFIMYCAQKHTKLDLERIQRERLKKKTYTSKKNQSKQTLKDPFQDTALAGALFRRNFQYYALEIFNVASGYLYAANTMAPGAQVMYVHSDGLEPIAIKVDVGLFPKIREIFVKGWYAWEQLKFGLTGDKLYLSEATLFLDGTRYPYNEEQNQRRLSGIRVLSFDPNFDFKEKMR